jgi:UDP-2-acetamido-3-amino-2,3-dideoxy-glucuronate N-acetyltransferase
LSVKYTYSPLKIAVLGCGNWGKNLIRVMSELGVLHSICDVDPNKIRHFNEKYGVPSQTFEEIAKDPSIDGVMISTPSITHYDLAHLMLQNNKHVFIEKPFALNVKEAVLLHQLASKQSKTLMVGHLLQYHPAFQTLKKLKQDNVFGNIHYICSHRSNFGNFQTEQNVLWDYAPHDMSMILSLIGEMPYQISAVGSNHLPHTQTDACMLNLNFHRNIQAFVFSSWIHPFKEQKLTIVGNQGMAIFDDCQPWETKLKVFNSKTSTGEYLPIAPAEPLSKECTHFLNCISQGITPLTNSLEGINVTTILESATQSLVKQQPVLVAEVTPLAKNMGKSDPQCSEKLSEETYIS